MTLLPRSMALLVALVATLAAGVDLYVAPDGNAVGAGTAAQPFSTLAQARDAIRGLKQAGPLPAGGVTVWVQAGVYPLAASFTLTAADSGTLEAPVVYRAVKGADVWLSGAVAIPPERFGPVTDAEITRLLPEEARAQVVQADLRAVGVPEDVKELPDKFSGFTGVDPLLMQVLCNGEWMTCARWPNEGFAKFEEIVDTGSGLRDYVAQSEKRFRPGVFRYAGERPARWNLDRGVWMLGYWARAYVCDVVRAGAIDTAKREITWKTPLAFGLDTWGANRWFAFNLIEELDTPGEWYVDRGKGILYFWPPASIGSCRVAVAGLPEPMVVFDRAENITFDGIGFEGGRQDAVVVKGGANVCLRACEIRNVGRHAVQLIGGKGHRVVGCDIHHVGYSGVIMTGGDRQTLEPAGFEVVNNHIYWTNRVKRTHASPINMNGVGMRLANNLIHHAPHSAVFYGGNDLIMEYNDIYWCHYETAEGGVFYAGYNWTFRGNEIRYNYIHHINDSLEGSPTDVRTVHLDDCVAGTAFRGNVVFRAGNGVAICGGPFNTVDNNLFIDCQVGAELETRGLAWWEWTRNPDGTVSGRDRRASHGFSTNNGLLNGLKSVPYDREPYTKYPHMADLLKVPDADLGAPWWCGITRNISINGAVKRVDRKVKPEWATIENNWDGPNDGDPGIVAPYEGDFRLKPNAPALAKTGFEPIPFERIGLVNDGTRRSWPVQAEPPPKDFKPAWLVRRELEKRMPLGLPVVTVRRAPAAVGIDGVISEWNSGEAYQAEILEGTALGSKAALPSTAWMGVDDTTLYVVFDNLVDPKADVVGGHTWGQSDAVEVALSVVEGDAPGPILIWRGYTDGQVETSDEAGAPKAKVEAALKGVRYACKLVAPGAWTAELAIPFAAIGVAPKTRNPRLLFSLAVRKVNGDHWVTWKKAPGGSWDVRRGGVLWLEPFGNIALSSSMPSQGNIHVMGKSGSAVPVLMKAVAGCEVATWENPVGCRVTAATGDLPADRWVPFSFTFTPEADGVVVLMLMGRGMRSSLDNALVPVWTYTDSVQVDGADLLNGGFEEVGAKGMPTGWEPAGAPLLVRDGTVAAAGASCVKTWHDGRMTQRLKVTAGRPVTVRCLVKGEPAAGK
jgi:hypothetical protein